MGIGTALEHKGNQQDLLAANTTGTPNPKATGRVEADHTPITSDILKLTANGLQLGGMQSNILSSVITSNDPAAVTVNRLCVDQNKIKLLQHMLNESGVLGHNIKVDGYWGDDLQHAIIEAQRKLGTRITRDGEAGPATFAALAARLIDRGKLHFTETKIQEKWEASAPLLKVFSRPLDGELINAAVDGDKPGDKTKRIKAAQKMLDIEPDGIVGERYNSGISSVQGSHTPQPAGKITIRELLTNYFNRQ